MEVNCATLRGDGAMSTLFWHGRRAYTGSGSDRAGLLKTADGEMLSLDEIGELALDEKAMLLRTLEEKRSLPVGANCEVESDFQLLAGTNRAPPSIGRDDTCSCDSRRARRRPGRVTSETSTRR